MNRLLVIKNKGQFSFVIDLFSWALPFNYDAYPGAYGWTLRFRILCFNFHFRTEDEAEYDPYEFYDEESDLPF